MLTRNRDQSLDGIEVRAGTLFAPEVPAVYYVMEGDAYVEQVSEEGQHAAIGVLGTGDAFAYRRPWLPASPDLTLRALSDVRLLRLRERDMQVFASRYPALAARVIAALARCAGYLAESHYEVAVVPARDRVLRALIRLADDHGGAEGADSFTPVGLPLSQHDLASTVGICRETATSILAELSRAGVVRTGRRTLSVHRERAIQALERTEVLAG